MEYALTSFDAVFAAALAMNNSMPQLEEMGLKLEEFDFLDTNTSAQFERVIHKELIKVQFQGISVSAWRLFACVCVCVYSMYVCHV